MKTYFIVPHKPKYIFREIVTSKSYKRHPESTSIKAICFFCLQSCVASPKEPPVEIISSQKVYVNHWHKKQVFKTSGYRVILPIQ
ncbi:hypothetical protein VN97_g2654 [Penicillium thymicola]|uniref:Uncharacterized protein n=1 Tax=Penicillium thymicola TaxID=293382 RepID=A0AAI9TNV9_PENTH|nr:hypothetical protein VN97_g2654 [Penicillium thymicola]